MPENNNLPPVNNTDPHCDCDGPADTHLPPQVYEYTSGDEAFDAWHNETQFCYCSGVPADIKQVTKGPNTGKEFFTCYKRDNPTNINYGDEGPCPFFLWTGGPIIAV